MKFTSETADNGVTERLFELEVAGEIVSGALWASDSTEGPRPLLLVGHGGGHNTMFPPLVAGARHYAGTLGYAVMAIDAPGHGPRTTPEWSARFAAAFRGGMGREAVALMAELAAQAGPEWKAALTAAQGLPFVGTNGPVGYMGVSLATQLGLPFVASEPRITAAAFGLAGLHPEAPALEDAARKLAVPVQFAMQWDDEGVPREAALALFDAIGSREKTLHANPGRHAELPPFERAGWQAFFARHFQVSNSAPAERRGSSHQSQDRS